jgi:hypothetical protein
MVSRISRSASSRIDCFDIRDNPQDEIAGLLPQPCDGLPEGNLRFRR